MENIYSRVGGGGKVKEVSDVSEVLSILHSSYEGGKSASKPGSEEAYIRIGY